MVELHPAEKAAGQFIRALQSRDYFSLWNLLTRESRGFWEGVWSERFSFVLGEVRRIINRPGDRRCRGLLGMIWNTFVSAIGEENLSDLRLVVGELRWLADDKVVVPLAYKVPYYPEGVEEPIYGFMLPLVLDDEEWKIDYVTAAEAAWLQQKAGE